MIEALLHPAVVAAIASILGAAAAVVTARYNKAPDVQAVTNAAVAGIIQHYTQALADQTKEVHALREEIAELRHTVERQNTEIADLNGHIIELSAALSRHGIDPPPRRLTVVG